jgi:hypothetical protein
MRRKTITTTGALITMAASVLTPRLAFAEPATRRTAPPKYSYETVRFPNSLDSQIVGITAAGEYTGNVVFKSGDRTFVDSGRAGAKPDYFKVPFEATDGTVATAGIDNAGEIVGNYADPSGVYHGFIRSPQGAFTTLSIPGAGTSAGKGTEIAGISPTGVIVGSFVGHVDYATGFIDDGGTITTYDEPHAGSTIGDGTAVEFYATSSDYGGVYINGDRVSHGWYVQDGKLHTVNDPAAGQTESTGTQLIGVDATGRLYGIEAPTDGPAESFSDAGGVFTPIVDPEQVDGAANGTLVLDVNDAGTLVGFYSYNSDGQTHAFIAKQVS